MRSIITGTLAAFLLKVDFVQLLLVWVFYLLKKILKFFFKKYNN